MSDEMTVHEATPVPTPAKGAAAMIPVGEKGIALRSLDDLLRFGRLAVASGITPKGMSEQGAAMAIQAGLERGLGPLGGLQNCIVINGVLSWRGQAAAALLQNSTVCRPGTYRAWTEGDGDEMKGVAVAWRVGYAEAARREFSVKDARQAGLWGKEGPWKQYPKRQLMWRAVGFLARDVFADVLGGFPIAEEAADFEAQAAPASPVARADMLPPPAPDPLLDAIGVTPPPPPAPTTPPPPVTPEPQLVAGDLFSAIGCTHPEIRPAMLAELAPGKALVCSDCGEELSRDPGPEA